MKIISLELFRYKRLLLTQTELFRIELTSPLQLILGTNGSGKSSILEELTPLPANHQEYNKEGYKIIIIDHLNSRYILTNTFNGAQKHSFMKDGVELNDGRTLTVQRDLVKQEFGITPDIHELLISKKGFCSLAPNERRQWFTKLSDVSYDYAISLYLKLKEKSRDVSGALKLAQKRLVTETSKVINRDEQSIIQEQVNDLYIFIQHLTELRKPVDNSIQTLNNNKYLIEQDLTKLSNLLFKKKLNLKHFDEYSSLKDIDTGLLNYQSLLEVEKILIAKYITEYNRLASIIKDFKVTEDVNITTLFSQHHSKNNEYENILSKQKLNLQISDYITTSNAFETVYDILNTVFISLPINSDRKFTKQKFLEVSDYISNLKNTIAKATSDLNKLHVQKTEQEHQRDHDKIECPKCTHKWSRGYDQQSYNTICTNIEIIQSQLDESVTVLAEKETYQEEIKNYSDIYRDFTMCINNWPILQPLWNYISNNNNIFENPRSVLTTLETFKYDLSLGIEINKIKNELDNLNNLIALSEKTNNEDLSNLNERIYEVEKLITESTKKTNTYNVDSNKLNNYKKDIEFILDLEKKLEALLTTHSLIVNNTYETYRRTSFNELIQSVQLNLSQKEQILSEIKIQKAIIQDLENQINHMEIDNEVYKHLVKELSPTDGLIAQGLLGFIKSFVKQMNILIKKIWAYPLQVIPCGINDGVSVELDYKFPLMVQTKDNTVKDVSMGSTAMCEVVDLVFKLTSMKYLGLSDAPIYLDEFAASFDSSHRSMASDVIKSLLDMNNFSQMFMISHYEQSYGSLTNAEICVLCPNNIVIPRDAIFNKHVIIQ